MKSSPLPIHDRIVLMAYQTVLQNKTVFVGLTISPEANKLTEIGMQVRDAVAAYAGGKETTVLHLSQSKDALKRFRAALASVEDGGALLTVAAQDDLLAPIIKALKVQNTLADVPVCYRIPDDWSLLKDIEQAPPIT